MAHAPLSTFAVPAAAVAAERSVQQGAIAYNVRPSAAPKRNRATRPKSKTGCHTCKKRHKKCDEARPFCKTCLTKGYRCDGYDGLPKSNAETGFAAAVDAKKEFALQPQRTRHSRYGRRVLPRVLPLYTRQPSTLPACGSLELQYFDAFRTLSLPHLTLAFKNNFFDGHVMRAAHKAPAIRHAMIALGALHAEAERGEFLTHNGCESLSSSTQSAFILEQYGKALTAAVDAARTNGRAASDLILGVCLLSVLFETLRGNCLAAQLHIQSGVDLVVEVLADLSTKNTTPPRAAGIPIESLVPLLARVDLQASDPSDHSAWYRIPNAQRLFEPRPVPPKFVDLEESKLVLLEYGYNFMTELRGAMLVNGQDLSTWPPMEMDKMFDLRRRYDDFLSSWAAAQTALTSELQVPLDSVDQRHLHLLSINFAWISTVVRQFPIADELTYDEHLDTFRQIVQTAGRLVGEGTFVPTRLTFTFDLGVSEPLFWVVMKCRDPVLRRQANEVLLKRPDYEGMFHSQLAAAIGRRTIAIEEGFCSAVTQAADVPRKARIQFLRPAYVSELNGFRVKLMNKFGLDREEVLSYSRTVHVERG